MIILFAGNSIAQINPVAIGFRACPDGGGITGKVFLNRNLNIELQVNGSQGFSHQPDNGPAYGPSWATVGLLEYNIIFPDTSWRIYFGAGLHFGKWDRYDHSLYDNQPLPQGIFGIDAILGVEYLFKSIPMGISADVKPAMNYIHDVSFFPNNIFGVSARYYFGQRVVIVKE